jgi:ubiquinone/menaquinone biosynthesis C-methylase UbiE
LVRRFLSGKTFNRVLEIGYGSGIFMPELRSICNELYGVDVHQKSRDVAETLLRFGVEATLLSARASQVPVEEHFFDCVLAVSAIEFVEDLRATCREVRRILRPTGLFFVVTPGDSRLLDIGLKLVTGESAEQDYGNRRAQVIPTVLEYFRLMEAKRFPRWAPPGLQLHRAMKLTHRDIGISSCPPPLEAAGAQRSNELDADSTSSSPH